MQWAVDNDHIVFTHDLDFGHLLAATNASGPSVVQIRANNILPDSLGERMVLILRDMETVLTDGALVVVDSYRSRVHVLPLK